VASAALEERKEEKGGKVRGWTKKEASRQVKLSRKVERNTV